MKKIIKLSLLIIGLLSIIGCTPPIKSKGLSMTHPKDTTQNSDINIGKIDFLVK